MLRNIPKEMVDYCAMIKYKTLYCFCFREHSARGWRQTVEFVFKLQDSFIALTNNVILQGLVNLRFHMPN